MKNISTLNAVEHEQYLKELAIYREYIMDNGLEDDSDGLSCEDVHDFVVNHIEPSEEAENLTKTELYTIDTLTAINKDNPNVLPITQADVDKVNVFVEALNAQLDAEGPQDGDRIILHGRNTRGLISYPHGHIEGGGRYCNPETEVYVCTQPMMPYISTHRNNPAKIVTEASGGYWAVIPRDKVCNTGRVEEKMFWNFVKGAGGHMGVYFSANVRVFEYTDLENIY